MSIFVAQNAIPAQDVARAVCLTQDIAVTRTECQQKYLKNLLRGLRFSDPRPKRRNKSTMKQVQTGGTSPRRRNRFKRTKQAQTMGQNVPSRAPELHSLTDADRPNRARSFQ